MSVSTPIRVALRRTLLALAAFAISFNCGAIERMEAPFELLYRADNPLVVGTLIEINPAGRLVFERKDVLGGKAKPPAKIDVRVPPSALADAHIGASYIVGYSTSHADPRQPTRVIANPDGPIVLVSVGLEPALFVDTPSARALLDAGRSEHRRESRRFFALLTEALQGTDAALQTLAAGEIALDAELADALRDGGGKIVETVARNPLTRAGVRRTLIEASAQRPAELGDWWRAASLELLASTPVDGYSDETSSSAGLVLSALELLGSRQVPVPSTALVRWLRSADPPLVERASVMLRRESPALERSAIQDALNDPHIPDRTRTFLTDHLRRLDIQERKSKAQTEGAARM